jgi:predicted AAA+ superfamily ATPase
METSMGDIQYERGVVQEVWRGLWLPKRLLHIIVGPRQVGKTTASLQIAAKWQGPVVQASADAPLPPGPEWLRHHWQRARAQAQGSPVLLILDEVQKVAGWSEEIKALWDQEVHREHAITVLLLGSSALHIQRGLSESLAGRFMLYRFGHWGYEEMADAFGATLEQWIQYGGYPGAWPLIQSSEQLWLQYVRDSLIETVLTKDVLQLQTIAKPALLRHLFYLSCAHPAQIFSYNKMLGQLQDAGNTTTLSHYVKLLESAFLLSGLEASRREGQSRRGSSPKLILWNNALISAALGLSLEHNLSDPQWWGRLTENAVGAHLLNGLAATSCRLQYWRQRDKEIDFLVSTPRKCFAIEVKSTRPRPLRGLKAFCENRSEAQPVILGGNGMPLEEFFRTSPREMFW